jgi:hypothetical protein
LVGYAHGLVAGASTQVLWASKWEPAPSHGAALPSQAITVVTDGLHSLHVWFGNEEIFSSDRLVLKMPAPFQAYLEVQSSGPAYLARFDDFWVADDAPLVLKGLPAGAQARLCACATSASALSGGGAPLAEALAGPSGTATLRLPVPVLVGTGTIQVTTGRHTSVLSKVPYSGGDVLRWARSR